jgi:hypothetical protein
MALEAQHPRFTWCIGIHIYTLAALSFFFAAAVAHCLPIRRWQAPADFPSSRNDVYVFCVLSVVTPILLNIKYYIVLLLFC